MIETPQAGPPDREGETPSGDGTDLSLEDDREPDGPTRRCIVTRAVRPRELMLRFVVSPEGMVVPDLDARLPGRGFWLSPGRDVIETASAKGAFARAARRSVTVPDDLAVQVDHLLQERCVGLIGLARKAGQAVCGFEKVKAMIRTQADALLLEAWDGAEDGRSKLAFIAQGPRHQALDRATLGRAFARAEAVHAAMAPGGLARRLDVDLLRLGRLRGRRGSMDAEVPDPGGKGRRKAVRA